MKVVAAVAETSGTRVIRDEVDIGAAWEDILGVVERKVGVRNRQLRFKTRATEHLDPWTFV